MILASLRLFSADRTLARQRSTFMCDRFGIKRSDRQLPIGVLRLEALCLKNEGDCVKLGAISLRELLRGGVCAKQDTLPFRELLRDGVLLKRLRGGVWVTYFSIDGRLWVGVFIMLMVVVG